VEAVQAVQACKRPSPTRCSTGCRVWVRHPLLQRAQAPCLARDVRCSQKGRARIPASQLQHRQDSSTVGSTSKAA
jgi:hypothetical protein